MALQEDRFKSSKSVTPKEASMSEDGHGLEIECTDTGSQPHHSKAPEVTPARMRREPCHMIDPDITSSAVTSPAIHRAYDGLRAECEVEFEGGPDLETLSQECQKNPGHTNFIPIREFLKPENHFFHHEEMATVRNVVDKTVRVLVDTVSADRPDVYPNSSVPYPYSDLKGRKDCRRCGTGFILYKGFQSHDKPCKCLSCRLSNVKAKDYYTIYVQTATHVVYNDEEAMDSVFECFYDSEDRKEVKYFYGISARSFTCDKSIVQCMIHDKELVQRFCHMRKESDVHSFSVKPEDKQGWIISHPHGRCKHASRGRFLHGKCEVQCREGVTDNYRVPHQTSSSSRKVTVLDDVEMNHPDYQIYKLPKGTSWIFPEHFYVRLDELYQELAFTSYIKAPVGTHIKMPGGKLLLCPSEAEFNLRDRVSNLVYDISTCRGCSGAPILSEGSQMRVKLHVCHSGVEGDYNMSSFSSLIGGLGWSIFSHFPK